MIRIKADKDGRLTQWDKARNVIITGLDSIEGVKVHFSSPTDNHDAYVVEPVENDGVVSAAIPDELLTIAGTIWVYVYPDSYTKSSAVLSVMRREKPDDYTYGGGGVPQVQTDWYQNDESAVDHIKNRIGGYTKTTPGYEITWDGVVGDKVVVDGGEMQLVKVSDRVFTVEELIGATAVGSGQSFTINNDDILSQNGVMSVGQDIFVFTTPTTIESITIPEAGTYFTKTEEGFVSSLSKPDSTTTVKIPAELTTVVGGYDAAERTAVIFDGTVKANDFTERSVSGVSYYFAPIALAEDLIEEATVSGTIYNVQVSGTVKSGRVALYKIATVGETQTSGGSLKVAEIGGDAGNYRIALGEQPESDLTIHLTQTAPAHAVTIPEEYLELTKTNAAIETAQNAANTAQSAASRAQTTADTAKTTAENAKTAADKANSEIRTKDLWFHSSETALSDPNVPYGIKIGSINSLMENPRIAMTTADGLIMCGDGQNPKVRHIQIKVKRESNIPFGYIEAHNGLGNSVTITPTKISAAHADTTVKSLLCLNGITLKSSTPGSTKKFRITVDDTGAISATEVTT